MTDDEFRWAEALLIQRTYGADAARWVAERIGALALAGDQEGVLRFSHIALRLDQLIGRGRCFAS